MREGRGDRLFTPGFSAVFAAQLFSLLGMEVLQFALPLHILNLTGSGTLYGAVVATSFVPYTLLAPAGGIIADRTRKRGAMVALDAALALVMLGYCAAQGSPSIVPVTVGVLMLAFASQAVYQPIVQSAILFVVPASKVPVAVAAGNQVSMLTGILGAVLGGAMYGFLGIVPTAAASAAAFAVSSALAAAFVRLPYDPPAIQGGVFSAVRQDLADAPSFLRGSRVIGATIAAATFVNFFSSSFINVGSSYIITVYLGLPNQLVGVASAALGAGGLVGSALVALRPQRFSVGRQPLVLGLGCLGLLGLACLLAAGLDPAPTFAGMVACYAWTMVFCMAMSVVAVSYIQTETPPELAGKVIALVMMCSNLAAPAGQLAYGVAFDHAAPAAIALAAAAGSLAVVALLARAYRRAGLEA